LGIGSSFEVLLPHLRGVGLQIRSSKECMTYTNYCKNFNLNSTAVVTNWIKRGIVPSENLLFIKEMNLKLIKAVPYMT
jgi:hypothetical protein